MPLTRLQLEIWIALAIVVLDQATKAAVRFSFDLHESVEMSGEMPFAPTAMGDTIASPNPPHVPF